ncbi:MAG: TonB-dependent receptor plug domain-containing protein [Candidatus Cryptobacteroides sp.]|nr:TonB-dependent receptor plug domain-containing protein [Bacteroidales bacterium]MDD6052478.1 TonB-dependent receptor plug domain-containing protein [Bacteroidales bacterium]
MKKYITALMAIAILLVQATGATAQKYTDIFQLIRGLPGVIVGQADPGVMPRIYIRGIGTNSDKTQPLFVVDGLITDNVASIDPENVESIDVLKDAGSTAIYGVEGANGVILITTVGASMAAKQEALERKAARKQKRARAAFEALKKMEKERADSLAAEPQTPSANN